MRNLVVLSCAVLLLAVIWAGYLYHSTYVRSRRVFREEYDFIVVGGGTAGIIVAHEISLHSNFSVLLIEAGGQFGWLSSIPLACTLLQGSAVDWAFRTVQQEHVGRGMHGRRLCYPRGKGLGGSGQLNYMLHSEVVPEELDQWMQLGGKYWGFESLKCYLAKLYRSGLQCHERFWNARRFHKTFIDTETSKLSHILNKATVELNFRNEANYTFRLAEYTTKNGRRWSAFDEYLYPSLRRPKFHLMMHTQVQRVIFDGDKRAIGVKIQSQTGQRLIKVRKEVILSAGAIQSPHLLMVSGVGEEKELKRFNIDVVHNSPRVGRNLFDHLTTPIYVSINETLSVTREKVLSLKNAFKYFVNGKGILSNAAIIGTVREKNASHSLMIFGIGSADEASLKVISNYDLETFNALFPLNGNHTQEGFILIGTCHFPQSRGFVGLRGSAISKAPLIDPNFLANISDVQCIRDALKLGMKVVQTKFFQKIGSQIHWPKLRQCRHVIPPEGKEPTEEFLECAIRTVSVSGHHPGGTCAIGQVLDNQLRVKGVRKLRVIDGSVFIQPLSAFPNSVIAAIAERASHMILEKYLSESESEDF
ncbi:neither inactivation nor afterpotential protein G [Phlebotomus argentipes]|uniref:neither inactivation nor afterpotential protein G n=1 Tax=Phlebotomus argentipes TaxID=94469 RepID=UPI002893445A|nr:neither inactivation nor afterpotential protein G [Phlebotomus argentipes]